MQVEQAPNHRNAGSWSSLPDRRREEIIRFLREHESARLGELARAMRVAPVTIHRDLDRLAREGQIERVRGGARIPMTGTVVSDWMLRLRQRAVEKRVIAAHATRFVEAGSTIFVDSSTTGLAFAEELALRPSLGVTLVTNSPLIAARLDAPSIHVIVTPGELDQELRLIGGHWAVEFLETLKFAAVFVSGASLDLAQGLGSRSRPLVEVINAARSVAEETIALVDSSKFGRTALLQIVALRDLSRIVTDEGLRATAREEYERAGPRLEIARDGTKRRRTGARA